MEIEGRRGVRRPHLLKLYIRAVRSSHVYVIKGGLHRICYHSTYCNPGVKMSAKKCGLFLLVIANMVKLPFVGGCEGMSQFPFLILQCHNRLLLYYYNVNREFSVFVFVMQCKYLHPGSH